MLAGLSVQPFALFQWPGQIPSPPIDEGSGLRSSRWHRHSPQWLLPCHQPPIAGAAEPLFAKGVPVTFGGSSVAAAFVTGAIALLWSEFPHVFGADVSGILRVESYLCPSKLEYGLKFPVACDSRSKDIAILSNYGKYTSRNIV